MSIRGRFLIATLCGLVLAAGTHIVVILASPFLARNDAFDRLRPTLDADKAQLLSPIGGQGTWVPRPDPAATVAACAFDLANGPTRIVIKTTPLFESLSFHAKTGGIFYAVTDRAAVRDELAVVVMTPRQLDEARAADGDAEPGGQQEVRVVSPENQGFAIVRVVSPTPSQNALAEAAAKSVSCSIEEEG
ncbi:MAG: hypothetical protein ABW026_18410 [Microvirga sp.]